MLPASLPEFVYWRTFGGKNHEQKKKTPPKRGSLSVTRPKPGNPASVLFAPYGRFPLLIRRPLPSPAAVDGTREPRPRLQSRYLTTPCYVAPIRCDHSEPKGGTSSSAALRFRSLRPQRDTLLPASLPLHEQAIGQRLSHVRDSPLSCRRLRQPRPWRGSSGLAFRFPRSGASNRRP